MKIIESIRKYIGELDCLSSLGKVININYLADDSDSFSIEEIPSNPILKKYVDGSSVRQFQFVFSSREPYGPEILQNLENSGFYEDFANEIENRNKNGLLPLLEDPLESLEIRVESTSYIVSVTEDTGMYQINLRLKYRKGV